MAVKGAGKSVRKTDGTRYVGLPEIEEFMRMDEDGGQAYWNGNPITFKFRSLRPTVKIGGVFFGFTISFLTITALLASAVSDYKLICTNNSSYYCGFYDNLFPKTDSSATDTESQIRDSNPTLKGTDSVKSGHH